MNWIRKEQEDEMVCKEHAGVSFLTFEKLLQIPCIKHGFSTRMGGVSEGIYSSMNLSYTRGDEEKAVTNNFRRMMAALEMDSSNLVFSDQTHTTNVRVVTARDRGKGFTKKRDYSDIDGLVTNVPGLVLATFYADCVPLYFVDPVKKAIGLSHSGWRGTVGKIGLNTVKLMQAEYGCDPADMIGCIAPSICQDCYEVSEDVIAEFDKAFGEDAGRLYYRKENGKYQLNLWKANELVMKEAGLTPEHIVVTDICTCCNADKLFSHRASHGQRGNLGAFLMLKEECEVKEG